MEDYVSRLEDIAEIRKADRDKPQSRCKLKEYRKKTGKIAWLAISTLLVLSLTALQLAKNNNSPTIAYLRNLNVVLKVA